MSNVVNLIYARFIQPYAFIITLIVVGVIFIWGANYAYTHYFKHPKKSEETDIANASSSSKIIQIYMFHVDWCPHCKTALPEWKVFADEWDGKQINGYRISCAEIDCTEDDTPAIRSYLEKYNVDSFPTVKAVTSDNVVDYDAKVTRKNLEKFINSIAQ